MNKALLIITLLGVFGGAGIDSASAQVNSPGTVQFSCVKTVTRATPLRLRRQLLNEPFECSFDYRVFRAGKLVSSGDVTVEMVVGAEKVTQVMNLPNIERFDTIEVYSATHSTPLPLDAAWVSGRCKPVGFEFPKKTETRIYSPYLGTYLHINELQEEFDCK